MKKALLLLCVFPVLFFISCGHSCGEVYSAALCFRYIGVAEDFNPEKLEVETPGTYDLTQDNVYCTGEVDDFGRGVANCCINEDEKEGVYHYRTELDGEVYQGEVSVGRTDDGCYLDTVVITIGDESP